jgi:hypothetical protein
MVFSIGKKSVFDTEPDNEVIGGEAAWGTLAYLDPDKVDMVAKALGGTPLGKGYPIAPDSAPKAMLWKSKNKLPPDYAVGNNDVMLVSSRFRDLVEHFEPSVHQFLPVNMYFSKKDDAPFDIYYWFVVCTLIDSLDRKYTTLTYRGDYEVFREDGFRKGRWYFDGSVTPSQRPVFNVAAIGEHHLWRDPYWGRAVVHCSDEFAKAMIAADLKGFGLHQQEQT